MTKSQLLTELMKIQEESDKNFSITSSFLGKRIIIEFE
jgi:hypothetical protein